MQLSVQFAWDQSVAIRPSIIFDISRMVTQCTIRGLSHYLSMTSKKSFWRTRSVHLPDLEEIHESTSFVGSLVAALRIEGAHIVYQSLHVLYRNYIDFQEYRPGALTTLLQHEAGVVSVYADSDSVLQGFDGGTP